MYDAPLERYHPLIDDWEAFLEALRRPLPTAVWVNTLRASADEVGAMLAAEGLEPAPLSWRPAAFRLGRPEGAGARLPYLAGLYHIQEEASMLPAWLLAPPPGRRVLDLCAAPGGKTAQLALALGGRGTVVANDLSQGRLNVVQTTLARLGLANVSLTAADAAHYPGRDAFDAVLLDAPCSCEGTARKAPRVLRAACREQSLAHGRRQQAMLRRALRLCRPGGRVAYATCTFAPEENEAVVDAALRAWPPGAVRVAPAALPGLRVAPGVTAWQGQTFAEEVGGCLRLWPHHNDTGGFFVAILEKADAP